MSARCNISSAPARARPFTYAKTKGRRAALPFKRPPACGSGRHQIPLRAWMATSVIAQIGPRSRIVGAVALRAVVDVPSGRGRDIATGRVAIAVIGRGFARNVVVARIVVIARIVIGRIVVVVRRKIMAAPLDRLNRRAAALLQRQSRAERRSACGVREPRRRQGKQGDSESFRKQVHDKFSSDPTPFLEASTAGSTGDFDIWQRQRRRCVPKFCFALALTKPCEEHGRSRQKAAHAGIAAS
jgi:hypothetical protein